VPAGLKPEESRAIEPDIVCARNVCVVWWDDLLIELAFLSGIGKEEEVRSNES
jgi:hypothetical protein